MKILLRAVAVILELIAVGLVYAVIAAVTSAGGAKPGVAVAYVVGAILLTAAAVALWRSTRRSASRETQLGEA